VTENRATRPIAADEPSASSRMRPDGYRVVNWRHKLRVSTNSDGTRTILRWDIPIWGWRVRCEKAGCEEYAATTVEDRLRLCATHADEYRRVVPWFLREVDGDEPAPLKGFGVLHEDRGGLAFDANPSGRFEDTA
jgi:hypothetical protein